MMRKLHIGLLALLLTSFFTGLTNQAIAQCATWNELAGSQKETAETAHVLYRDFLKVKDYKSALGEWKKAYDLAPAADGQRDWHFTDGIEIYLNLFKAETDEAKKKEYTEQVKKLYDGAVACIESGAIKIPNTAAADRIAFLRGRQAYDMFYTLNTPYTETLTALQEAVNKGGNKTEYIVFDPYARVVIYLFSNDKFDKAATQELYKQLNEIADYNIANNKTYSDYYKTAKESMNAIFGEYEAQIFDCEYFKEKLLPVYNEHKDSLQLVQEVYSTLLSRGCDTTQTFMREMRTYGQQLAAAMQEERNAELRKTNPAYDAGLLYKEEKYTQALARYKEAIDQETDPSKKADYYFAVASIEYRKLDRYSSARENARKAASLKDGWGQPYMLIGDMYAETARSCGDAWEQRLAILAAVEKYSTARSIDSAVSEEANRKIGIYNGSLPEKQEGFMRGVSEGQSVKVGCWIGETVKVRFQ